MAGRRWTPTPWAALAMVLGCNGVGTTATGPQGFEIPDFPDPDPVRYAIVLLASDTTLEQNNFVLRQRAAIRTQAGLAVAAATVDFSVTVGRVDPGRTSMGDDGTVTLTWSIPPDARVGNLSGCARPPGRSCNVVSLLKWNR